MTTMTKWTIVHYERTRTMFDTFYITCTENSTGTWYMLLVKESHFCLASGKDLETLTQVIHKYVKRYRTRDRFMRALKGLSYGCSVSAPTFEQRRKDFLLYGEDYEDLVHSIVEEAFREAREEDKENSPLRKTTTRLKRAGRVSPPPKPVVEERTTRTTTPTEDSPRILRKPRVFKHK